MNLPKIEVTVTEEAQEALDKLGFLVAELELLADRFERLRDAAERTINDR